MVGIYKITNPSGKIYIGQSWNLPNRKAQYKGGYCRETSPIYNSLRKYGWENHVFEIQHILPEDIIQEVLDRYEIYYWQQYKACGHKMLNAKEPGKGGKHLIETKHKISKTKTGFKHSKETIGKIGEKLKGRLPVTPKKAVVQYSKEGVFINEFDSQILAAISLGVKQSAAICECCQGKRKSYKGYI